MKSTDLCPFSWNSAAFYVSVSQSTAHGPPGVRRRPLMVREMTRNKSRFQFQYIQFSATSVFLKLSRLKEFTFLYFFWCIFHVSTRSLLSMLFWGLLRVRWSVSVYFMLMWFLVWKTSGNIYFTANSGLWDNNRPLLLEGRNSPGTQGTKQNRQISATVTLTQLVEVSKVKYRFTQVVVSLMGA